MNEDQIKGKAKRAEDTAQETWGKATEGSENAIDKAIDNARDRVGDLWREAKDRLEHDDAESDEPRAGDTPSKRP